ncbi:MAG: polyribonucleotide nucleotidyltransferase, partial [Chloroflexi bacterium]|nr:polyribonucleotide nucleotidyltransferase [Chloroflexota bacterium]
MSNSSQVFESLIGGRKLRLETGKLAEQANAAVTVQYGETVVLVTTCASKEPRQGIDFLPLTVDYEERLYAAGKIPGGWFKREGRPSEDATLAARLTDRPLRPLFPKGLRNDIQVVATVLSTDRENDPDILSIIGASAALVISDIPFTSPVAATRIGMLDGHLVVNPTFTERNESALDLVVAGTRDAVMMVEAGASELPEATMLEAIRLAQETNRQIVEMQERMVAELGKPKFEAPKVGPSDEAVKAVQTELGGRLGEALFRSNKAERVAALDALRKEVKERLQETYPATEIEEAFESILKKEMRARILERGIRADGRGLKEVRPIWCEVGSLPRTHGSGLFNRGQTQVLTIVTLGSPGEEQRFDSITPEEHKRFLHHYHMPP